MKTISPEFYENIKNTLEDSRKIILKNYVLAEDETFVRSTEEAQFILDILQKIHVLLRDFFLRHPSLEAIFDKEFGPFKEFIEREVIIELCFLDDFLFPELETFSIAQDDQLNHEILLSYVTWFENWCVEKENLHNQSQAEIESKIDINSQEKSLICHCHLCVGDFRTKMREFIYQECVKVIEEGALKIELGLDQNDLDNVKNIFYDLQKEINQKLHFFRFRLRRSTLNKLENSVKGIIKGKFSYNSDLGKKYIEKLMPFLNEQLVKEGLPADFLGEVEFQRFFMQLGANLWREEKYLSREFSKIVKSIMRLKRKDISAGILQEYLGQFWLHAEARRIKRKIIYHMGPTNSGKTYHAISALCEAKRGCYLAPLRLLAGEWFDTMNARGVSTSLLTGEEVVDVEGATHYSSTIEMARLSDQFDCCVIDEIQMMSDPQRGWAWTRALVGMYADEIHLCGDGSVVDLVKTIVDLTGDELEIRQYERLTELQIMSSPIPLGSLEKGDALIVFSRRNALKYKSDLEKLGFKVSIVYGRLGPEVRREQARKFDMGETDIMVSTDAIAMGMNLPIRRIVFSTLTKYINDKEYQISDSEIKQIAGRAGRFKRFPTGFVTCLSRVDQGIELIKKAIHVQLPQSTKAMVGPDLDIFNQVNNALLAHSLTILQLSEFLRLFNTMEFKSPFYCVDLTEMIELTEIVEQANEKYKSLSSSEIFGFACAPVNMGLVEHVQYFIYILNNFIRAQAIQSEEVDHQSDNIDYLETSIKCVELYQWLARHFTNKYFEFDEQQLLKNKGLAIERLNELLSDRVVPNCSSCGKKLELNSEFNICEECFRSRRFARNNRGRDRDRDRDRHKNGERNRDGGGRSHHAKSSRRDRDRDRSGEKDYGPRGTQKGKRKFHQHNHDQRYDSSDPSPSTASLHSHEPVRDSIGPFHEEERKINHETQESRLEREVKQKDKLYFRSSHPGQNSGEKKNYRRTKTTVSSQHPRFKK